MNLISKPAQKNI